MTTDRAFRGVVQNFLGTYVSRYSDYDGYWLFGFVVNSLDDLSIDLLASATLVPRTPLAHAASVANQRFADQVRKARLHLSRLRGATLFISRRAQPAYGFVNGHRSTGHVIAFRASAVTAAGHSYSAEAEVFVAPHNPGVERRSTRAVGPSDTTPNDSAA